MARKKKGAALVIGMTHSEPERMSTDISKAENGFIVNVSGHSGGRNPSFTHKQYIAHSRPHAVRIAAHHFAGSLKGGRGRGKSRGGMRKRALL